ncbi:MAG: ATP phosphoribosyltransferase regulatory subunit [Patescibacteria group bacterium]|nr:ATP phosphoribosyltransferase regulatory subunit [Patescibacteria group bacterium]MDE2116626.1 ATP phosphoribosyltransferase regulatory subunit [Patescibacteria group bacterium]
MSQAALAKRPTTKGKTKRAKIDRPKYVSYDHIDAIGEAALFYGFTPLALPHIHPDDSAEAKKISEGEIVVDHDDHQHGASVRLEEKIALLRLYEREKMWTQSQPVMFYYRKPFVGDRRKPNPHESHHGMEIIGTNKSIAEALLIQAALAALKDAGEKDLHVEINSIGDKESLTRFTREITAYYRKRAAELPVKCREAMRKDVFSLLGCDHEACRRLAEECPKSINFLSERSRQHFKEVLEYLETLEIPYIIKNALVANRDYCSETVFEIRKDDPASHPLAIGIRYDTLARRLGAKKDLPAVGVSLALSRKTAKSDILKPSRITKILDPQVCFMQLGFEAKLKSLRVIEALREARVPVLQSLAKDKIAGQVGIAEKAQTPVVVIMGKKEAMEDSVIVRESATRSQDTILIKDLAQRLKKYKV